MDDTLSGKLGDQSTASTPAQKEAANAKTSPTGSAGVGQASGSQASVTPSAISGIAGNTSARTGDASTALTKNWNGQQLMTDVQAQVQITAQFGQLASKAVGDYGQGKQDQATKDAATARASGDEAKAQQLDAEAANWAEGGAYRIAAHAVVGGLTGGVNGAL